MPSERELHSRKAINDNYLKTIIIFCRIPISDIDGIHIISLLD